MLRCGGRDLKQEIVDFFLIIILVPQGLSVLLECLFGLKHFSGTNIQAMEQGNQLIIHPVDLQYLVDNLYGLLGTVRFRQDDAVCVPGFGQELEQLVVKVRCLADEKITPCDCAAVP